jgi:hypothetical protein
LSVAHPQPVAGRSSAQQALPPAAPAAAAASDCAGSSRAVGVLLALSIGLAALVIGIFVGFLFGLPRSLTSSDFRAAAQLKAATANNPQTGGTEVSDAGSGPGSPAVNQALEVNTNLEKISDWLTTIIVGVGLTKLQEIPGGIELFGDRVAPYFGYGGKVFGISSGLFFLLVGFFLGYVGTRVKLSWLFLWSQLTNQDATGRTWSSVIRTATEADPLQTPSSSPADENVRKADQIILSKSLSDLKSPGEVVAWANAKARAGDFASALAAYRDVQGQLPASQKLQTDYAQVLAASGDTAAANNVVANLATISPAAEHEALLKVAAASQAGQAAALRTRLQQGLYKPAAERGYDDSITAGEQLLNDPTAASDAWNHLWLAAAYGQKHAAEKAAAGANPTAAQQNALEGLRARAVAEASRAVELDAGVKPILRGLYDPRFRIGNDDDLDSLRPDNTLDSLLGGNQAGT